MFGIMVIIKLCLIFLWPFLAALLCVFLTEPIVKIVTELGISRKFGVFIGYLLLLVVSILLLGYLTQYIYRQFNSFLQNFTQIIEVLDRQLPFLRLGELKMESIFETVQSMVASSMVQIMGTLANTLNGVLYTMLVLISAFFISLDYIHFKNFVKKNVSQHLYQILGGIYLKTTGILRTELLLILLTTLQTILGLFLIGINNALTIGLICGILDLLPVVGPAVVFGPYIVYEVVTGSKAAAIGLAGLYILLQITREFMKVKLVGDNLKIHPFITLVAIYIGILFYGIAGVLVGPILVIVLQELIHALREGSITI